MGATSIHVQAVKPGSEIHNFREKELDYVRPELSHLNESWVGDSISHRLESAKQRYLDTVGQKMQAKAAPIREGVIVIKQETTMQELQQFATVCKERFGIEAFQIHIHKDEGYMNAKQWTPNLHAHVVFDWTQPNGKSVRLSRDDMAELQTIAIWKHWAWNVAFLLTANTYRLCSTRPNVRKNSFRNYQTIYPVH